MSSYSSFSRKRLPGVWDAWTRHCPMEHAPEYTAFKASNPYKQGITPLFCTQWRKDHPEEYSAFEAKWKEEHPPKGAPAEASPASDAAASAPPSSVRKPFSEEMKAKMAQKRAATKAAKALAVAPAKQIEFMPFTLAGKKYVRLGQYLTDGNHIWASGDLWESKKGQKGPYVGVLQEDGTIDLNADEPEIGFNENNPELESKIVTVSSPVASAAAGADAPPFLAPAFTKQYALVEERKGDFERVIMTKMAEGWELQGSVSFLPSGRYLQAIHRDTRKRNNSGAGSSGGRRKLTRKSLRY